MPGGQAHKVGDQFPSEGGLSESQFEALTDLLNAQHEALKQLLEPVAQVAALLLAEKEKAV